MKFFSAVALCLILLLGSFSGCLGESADEETPQDETMPSTGDESNPPQDETVPSTDGDGENPQDDSTTPTDDSTTPVDDSDENSSGIVCPDGSAGTLDWGVVTCVQPDVFRASDVSQETENLTLEWYQIAANEWGNYGPVEIYIVGDDIDAARELEDHYCERHKALDDKWNEEWDCANENYQIFTHYVEEGGAAIGTQKRSDLDYDFSLMIMSAKYPGPDEEDYKPVTIHEYFHIFQHAHISDECVNDDRYVCERDAKMGGKDTPWFSEGGAEFMAQLLYSRQPGMESNALRDAMERKLMNSLDGYQAQDIALDELTYSSEVNVYGIGSWFIAYLIHNEGEEAFVDGFYGDLDELGFDASFEKNFNSTRDEYIASFNAFLEQPIEDILSIIPIGEEEPSEPVSCSEGETPLVSLTPGVSERTLMQEIDGEDVSRSYLIHAPQTIDVSQCYPLLFVLHGNGGEPDGFQYQYEDMVNAGEFVGIYPAGHERSWNLGREASTANDTEFLEAVADSLLSFENLNNERRYVFGFSNGAGMAHTLGTESSYFSAFAAVVTSLTTENIPASGSGNPSVLQILGEDDDLIPYEGGEGVAGHVFLSGDESARTWAEHNGCTMDAVNTTLNDGSVRTAYTGCIGGGEVVNYKVANAGHDISSEFEGGLAALMWNFVSRF